MAKLLVSGTVEGVDFTKAGSLVTDKGDTITYPDSVRLQLSTVVDITKQGIKTKVKRGFSVNVPIEGDLVTMVEQYQNYIGKEIQCGFVPTEGQKFNLTGDIKVIKT